MTPRPARTAPGADGAPAPDTRTRILLVAAELFRENGYAGTSLRDISERIGTTKAALYYHFRSKEEILAALVEPVLAGVDAFLDHAERERLTPEQLVPALIDLLTAAGAGGPALPSDPSMSAVLAGDDIAARRRRLARLIAGPDAEPLAVARARGAMAAVEAMVESLVEDGAGPFSDDIRRELVGVALAVLRPDGPPPA